MIEISYGLTTLGPDRTYKYPFGSKITFSDDWVWIEKPKTFQYKRTERLQESIRYMHGFCAEAAPQDPA